MPYQFFDENEKLPEFFYSEEYDPVWDSFDWTIFTKNNNDLNLQEKRKLLFQKDSFGDTPLAQACWKEDLALVKAVIQQTPSEWQEDLLLKRNRFSVIPIMQATNNRDLTEFLLNFHPREQLAAQTDEGESILHFAIYNKSEKTVDFLIQKHPTYIARTIQQADRFGVTPLHLAIIKGSCSIAQKLILFAQLNGFDITKQTMGNGVSAQNLAKNYQRHCILEVLKTTIY